LPCPFTIRWSPCPFLYAGKFAAYPCTASSGDSALGSGGLRRYYDLGLASGEVPVKLHKRGSGLRERVGLRRRLSLRP